MEMELLRVKRLYATGDNSFPSSVAVGDFNNDHRLDIVVANHYTNNVGIFFGFGNGTFESQITYSMISESHPESITVGDFNNDTQLDIVAANYGDNTIGLLLLYDNGTFEDEEYI